MKDGFSNEESYIIDLYAQILLTDCFHSRAGVTIPAYENNHNIIQAVNLLVCNGWVTENPDDDKYYITDEGIAEILARNL